MTIAPVDPAVDYNAVAALLQDVLQAVNDTWIEAGIDLPARQYIHLGAAAMDCEQVTVQLLQVFLGSPGVPPGTAVKCESVRSAMIRINIIRKAPTLGQRGQVPDADALSDAAITFSRDLWLLLTAISKLDRVGGGVLADVEPIDPQGGYAGAGLNLTITIP